MYVVMITPECAPVAKVGGLGDVVQGLSYEESIRGNLVEIILPKYDCMRSYRMQSYFGKIISTKLPLMDSSYDSPCTTSPSPPTLATGAHSGVIITTYIPASSSIMPNSIVTKSS